MARSAPIVDHGIIPGPTGVREAFWAKFVEKLTSILSAGVQAWEAADVISDIAGNRQIVYHSVGDRSLVSGAGDADIWARVSMPSAGNYRSFMYQDWSPTSHTGHREAGYTGGYQMSLIDTAAVEWWFVGNEYECVMIAAQSGAYKAFGFGQLIRPFSTKLAGIARNTSAIASTPGTQTVSLDRDLTGQLQAGQRVWLLNQTPDGVALQTPGVNLATVDAVGASSVTLSGITQAYAIGSLIGLDPQPVYVNPAGGPLQGSGHYLAQTGTGTYTGAGSQLGDATHVGMLLTEADVDPGPDQLYPGYQAFIRMSSAPAVYRGKMQHVRAFSTGLQANGDLMQVDFDADNQWWVFPELSVSNWSLAIGPGAT